MTQPVNDVGRARMISLVLVYASSGACSQCDAWVLCTRQPQPYVVCGTYHAFDAIKHGQKHLVSRTLGPHSERATADVYNHEPRPQLCRSSFQRWNLLIELMLLKTSLTGAMTSQMLQNIPFSNSTRFFKDFQVPDYALQLKKPLFSSFEVPPAVGNATQQIRYQFC